VSPDNWNFWILRWTANHGATTRAQYLKILDQFLQFIDYKSVFQLSTLDIEDYQRSLVGLAPRTIAMRVAAVCSLVSYIAQRNLALMNVGAAVKRVKVPNDLAQRILSEQDVLRVIDSETKPWKQALLRLFYGTGIRPGELVRIQRRHISELPEGDSGRIIIHGKGGKTRTVNCFKSAWTAVAGILPADPEAFLFPNKHGGPMHPVYASFIVSEAGRKAGFQRISGIWLRHCHATHSLEGGAPIHLVAESLGHSSIAVTGKYLHANPKDSSGRYLAI